MATRNRPLSQDKADNSAPVPSVWKDVCETFYIQKGGLALKITLHGANATVAVSSFKRISQSLAESMARGQEILLQKALQKYQGRHFFGYLLTLYNDQGWLIKTNKITLPVEDGKDGLSTLPKK